MKAEIGISETKQWYLMVETTTETEWALLQHVAPLLGLAINYMGGCARLWQKAPDEAKEPPTGIALDAMKDDP